MVGPFSGKAADAANRKLQGLRHQRLHPKKG